VELSGARRQTAGRPFRVTATALWIVHANLSLTNMDFEGYSDNTGPDGVFRESVGPDGPYGEYH